MTENKIFDHYNIEEIKFYYKNKIRNSNFNQDSIGINNYTYNVKQIGNIAKRL